MNFDQILELILNKTDSRILYSSEILVVLLIIYFIASRIVTRLSEKPAVRYNWKKGITYFLVILGLILIGRMWVRGLESVFTLLGIVAAALTITLKDFVQNLLASVIIIWRNLFTFGDRIEIGDCKGDVIDLGLFYFTLIEIGEWVDTDQSTGRIIKIPNGLVLTNPVINYTSTFPYIWNEISFIIKAQSDWKKLKAIMLTAAEEFADYRNLTRDIKTLRKMEHENILIKEQEPKIYLKINYGTPSGIKLTLRYLCYTRNRRDIESTIIEKVLSDIQADDNIKLDLNL